MAEKSKPTGFSKGLITDTDPRFQIEGSYRDAMNVKLINSDGATFTIENINGNKKVLDLDTIDKYRTKAAIDADGQGALEKLASPLSVFKPFADDDIFTVGQNEKARGSANIVGSYSFKNQLFLIVCGYIGYGVSWGSQSEGDFRTVFYLIDFDDQGEVIKCTDLQIAYTAGGGDKYPNLNMDPLIKCRVEGIIENEGISRVYWTDNKNPLRTLNLKDPDNYSMDPEELDLTPKSQHNQGVAVSMTSGNLPVGVYQYCYKYLTNTGAESGISPFSNMYHISNSNSSGYRTYSGSSPGETSSDGFQIKYTNLDTRFDRIKVYALFYSSLDVPPLVGEVTTVDIGLDGTCQFFHGQFTESIDDGIAQVLIPSNTWDVCKDIAIKDNVLFAANLRSKKNFVTEKEWNVKILRYRLNNLSYGSLTTTDTNIVDYYHPNESYDPDLVVEAGSNRNYIPINIEGKNHTAANRYLPTLGSCTFNTDGYRNTTGADGNFSSASSSATINRKILGGQSYGYYETSDGATGTNGLGGVIMSFRMLPKVSDTIDNRDGVNNSNAVFFGSDSVSKSFQTDNLEGADGGNQNVDTEYTATVNMGSNKDPMASGSKRGYQRGETYRFGVLVYDKNGDPGNVLWMGDIQMPEHYDKAWELDLPNTALGRDASNGLTKWKENSLAQDYRMSSMGSATVPAGGVHYDNTSGWTTSSNNGNGKILNYVPQNAEGLHHTMDLGVDFTFRIPPHVRNKISGFRVVRAERKEADRTILQSGLLNDIVNYGIRNNDTYAHVSSKGYVEGTDSPNHSHTFGTKVESDDLEMVIDTNINEIYDQVLNGYAGLNATSNSVVDSDGTNVKYLNETDGAYLSKYYGSAGEFGSYSIGRYSVYDDGDSQWEGRYNVFKIENAVLMYSPDSIFGLRPYIHRPEHKLNIVSTLKLYDQRRFNDYDLNTHNSGLSIRQSLSLSIGSYQTTGTGYSSLVHPKDTGSNIHFHTRKTTKDNESGVMVGKCYVYDTYYNHYIDNYDTYDSAADSYGDQYVSNPAILDNSRFVNSGDIGAGTTQTLSNPMPKDSTKLTFGTVSNFWPNQYMRYSTDVTAAKEIGPGEFVPPSFFSDCDVDGTNTGGHRIMRRGYANFSLGRSFLYGRNSYQNALIYGKVNIPDTETHTYETVSTLQMGTRSIVIGSNVNNNYYNRGFANVQDIGAVIGNQDYYTTKVAFHEYTTGEHQSENKLPYYLYGNIVQDNLTQYGGRTLDAINKTRWIIAGNFHPINENDQHQHTTVFGGDTFVNLFSHQITTSPYEEKSYSKFLVFPVESYVNTDLRSGNNLGNNNHIEGFDTDSAPFSNDWLYNPVYSQESNLKSFLSLQETDQDYVDLPNEIAYSKTKLSGEENDAFRIFPIFNFYDVEAIYGEINRLINYNNEIHFFQDKAFGQLLVNPRTFLQDASGAQNLFTGSGDTIESHQYISVKYGSRHMYSVVSSERNLYFFDINYHKFLKYGVDKKLVSISDDMGTRNLFERASKYGRLKIYDKYNLAPRVNLNDMPLNFIGVHAAFDYFENTIYMTFADRLRIDTYDRVKYPEGKYVIQGSAGPGYAVDPEDPNLASAGVGYAERFILNTTIGYNEDLEAVVSKYSMYPQQWIEHQGKLLTPKARLPWIRIDAEGLRSYGFFDSANNTFGSILGGVYGSTKDYKYNSAKYSYSTHELVDGNVELWEWNNKETEKNVFFSDEFLHAYNSNGGADAETTIDLPNKYPLVLEVKTSTGTLEGVTSIGKELKLIGSPEESGDITFYNSFGTEYGSYNTNTGVVTITNTSTINHGDLLKSVVSDGTLKIVHESYVEKVINDQPQDNKKYDNINIIASVGDVHKDFSNGYVGEGNKLLTKRGDQTTDAGVYFEDLEFITDFSEGQKLDISTIDKPGYPSVTEFTDTLHKYREGILRMPLRYKQGGARLTGTYLRVKLTARTTEKINIFAITAKYRKSYN